MKNLDSHQYQDNQKAKEKINLKISPLHSSDFFLVKYYYFISAVDKKSTNLFNCTLMYSKINNFTFLIFLIFDKKLVFDKFF